MAHYDYDPTDRLWLSERNDYETNGNTGGVTDAERLSLALLRLTHQTKLADELVASMGPDRSGYIHWEILETSEYRGSSHGQVAALKAARELLDEDRPALDPLDRALADVPGTLEAIILAAVRQHMQDRPDDDPNDLGRIFAYYRERQP